MPEGTYEGRLVADGNGNLLAYEARRVGTSTVAVHGVDGEPLLNENGEQIVIEVPMFRYGKNHGKAVVYDEDNDNFRFLKKGEPSHNEQHHKNAVEMVLTQDQDPDSPGYAGTPSKPVEGMEHHFLTGEDIPPVRQLPDNVAVLTGGHTQQHKNDVGGEE